MPWSVLASRVVVVSELGRWILVSFTPPVGTLALACRYTPTVTTPGTWETYGFFAATILVDGISITDKSARLLSRRLDDTPWYSTLGYQWEPGGLASSMKAKTLGAGFSVHRWVGVGTFEVARLT